MKVNIYSVESEKIKSKFISYTTLNYDGKLKEIKKKYTKYLDKPNSKKMEIFNIMSQDDYTLKFIKEMDDKLKNILKEIKAIKNERKFLNETNKIIFD